MYVENKQTGKKCNVRVEKIGSKDFSIIRRSKKFDFDWNKYKGEDIYKLCLDETGEILGLMHVIDHPDPCYDVLEINVIEISKDNRGENGFGRIGGCLLAYAVLLSQEYHHDGYLVLTAKNKKASLFHSKYGFQYIGKIGGVMGERMVSDTANSIELVKEYADK
ncbi:hypothetical protein [Chitinophaga sp.]|uniref:hypothetical protein n=1 Tax=Chitinophaga sp. TaxID=1869181 RepID=UPI0031DE4967